MAETAASASQRGALAPGAGVEPVDISGLWIWDISNWDGDDIFTQETQLEREA